MVCARECVCVGMHLFAFRLCSSLVLSNTPPPSQAFLLDVSMCAADLVHRSLATW
jgi:hypothetical protein